MLTYACPVYPCLGKLLDFELSLPPTPQNAVVFLREILSFDAPFVMEATVCVCDRLTSTRLSARHVGSWRR